MGSGLANQVSNPDVEVDVTKPDMVIRRQIAVLKEMTSWLKAAYSGNDISFDTGEVIAQPLGSRLGGTFCTFGAFSACPDVHFPSHLLEQSLCSADRFINNSTRRQQDFTSVQTKGCGEIQPPPTPIPLMLQILRFPYKGRNCPSNIIPGVSLPPRSLKFQPPLTRYLTVSCPTFFYLAHPPPPQHYLTLCYLIQSPQYLTFLCPTTAILPPHIIMLPLPPAYLIFKQLLSHRHILIPPSYLTFCHPVIPSTVYPVFLHLLCLCHSRLLSFTSFLGVELRHSKAHVVFEVVFL